MTQKHTIPPEWAELARKAALADELLTVAQAALGYLTDHAIDLEGEPEDALAGLRIALHDTIEKAKGGQP